MARISSIPQKQRFSVAVVGDGQTERIYFSDLIDTDRPSNLTIFPDYPRKIGNYKGVLERAKILSSDYDQVYALIDMDKVIKENQKKEYENDKKISQKLKVIVLENNPCFEIWFLLHFLQTSKLFKNCNEVVSELMKPKGIINYRKNEKFLLRAHLYKNLKERIGNHAIPNAKLLEQNRSDHDQLFPRSETFRFFEWYFKMHPAVKAPDNF